MGVMAAYPNATLGGHVERHSGVDGRTAGTYGGRAAEHSQLR